MGGSIEAAKRLLAEAASLRFIVALGPLSTRWRSGVFQYGTDYPGWTGLALVAVCWDRRWSQRDLALSLADKDPGKQAYMLQRLAEAQRLKIKRKQLDTWLAAAAQGCDESAAASS